MNSILLYSTAYHLRQKEFIFDIVSTQIQVGAKSKGFWFRLFNFVKAIIICFIKSKQKIYIPRAGSKDIWIIYKLFKRRCVLISDGLSDCLPYISISDLNRFIGFREQVDSKFHVLSLTHQKLPISYSAPMTDIAIFTKRGRDYDYVSDYASHNFIDNKKIINPSSGDFCAVLVPASTIVFELSNSFPREKILVISCSLSKGLIADKRRLILMQYEDFLNNQGYRIIG